MINDTGHPEQDPAEGSREVIDRDLARQDGKRTDGKGQASDPVGPETGKTERANDPVDHLIVNPSADGTRDVEEPANDWPSDDRPL